MKQIAKRRNTVYMRAFANKVVRRYIKLLLRVAQQCARGEIEYKFGYKGQSLLPYVLDAMAGITYKDPGDSHVAVIKAGYKLTAYELGSSYIEAHNKQIALDGSRYEHIMLIAHFLNLAVQENNLHKYCCERGYGEFGSKLYDMDTIYEACKSGGLL